MKDQTKADAAREWLSARPGVRHRPRDMARDLGWTNHQAATTLGYLWRQGEIGREQVTLPGGTGPAYSKYGTQEPLPI